MVRRAEVSDLPRIEGCAREFYGASRILGRLPFDIDRFVAAWTQLLESGIGVVFVAEEAGEVIGCIGGMIYPDLYSGVPVATEFFWIVQQEHRGSGLRLYKAFENWARKHNCVQIRMVHLSDSMPERLSRFYKHFGYEPAETHYVLQLES